MNDYTNIRLDKTMYRADKSFSQQLEMMDPSDRYTGPLGRLDAFQRQLKRFDIKVGGAASDQIAKFFATSDSAALFPEYVARAVRQGMEEAKALESILASTTVIDSMDYRTISTLEEDMTLADVMEGGFIPQTTIKLRESLVHLYRRGRMLAASYEAIKFQKLDLFTVALRQIGASIARSQLKDAVGVLLNGDEEGNDNAATPFQIAGTSLAYGDLLTLWEKMGDYQLNVILASPDMAVDILKLEQFQSTAAGADFQKTGKLVTPLGATLISSSAVPAGTVIGLDHRYALQKISAGEVRVDADKLIDCQLERAAVTTIAGFAKVFPEAVQVMKESL